MTTTTMEPITIRFERTGYFRYRCFFCRGESWKESLQPMVYSGEDHNGVICRQCLAATPGEFAARLRDEAASLMQLANTLLDLAKDPLPRPTLNAFNAAVEAEEHAKAAWYLAHP